MGVKPAELRERSRRCREAARRAVDVETKRRFAAEAFAAAQRAEALEREVDSKAATVERHVGPLAQTLSNKTGRISKALTGEPQTPEDLRRQIKAWRMRAEELRTVAEQFLVPSVQESLRRAADNYDTLAGNAERRLATRSIADSGSRSGPVRGPKASLGEA